MQVQQNLFQIKSGYDNFCNIYIAEKCFNIDLFESLCSKQRLNKRTDTDRFNKLYGGALFDR